MFKQKDFELHLGMLEQKLFSTEAQKREPKDETDSLQAKNIVTTFEQEDVKKKESKQ